MEFESERWLLGVPVVDADGRRLGRVAAAYYTVDPHSVVWLVVRLPGLRRRFRAVLADDTAWDDAAESRLRVAHVRTRVLASPEVDEDSLDTRAVRDRVGSFYTARRACAPC